MHNNHLKGTVSKEEIIKEIEKRKSIAQLYENTVECFDCKYKYKCHIISEQYKEVFDEEPECRKVISNLIGE